MYVFKQYLLPSFLHSFVEFLFVSYYILRTHTPYYTKNNKISTLMKFEYIMHRLWLIVNVYYIMYIYDESRFIGPF